MIANRMSLLGKSSLSEKEKEELIGSGFWVKLFRFENLLLK